MKSKTCGECQWYDYHHLLCVVGGDVASTDCACDSFIPIKLTNGDKIRQMSNEELAFMLVPKVMFCDGCPAGCEEKDIPSLKECPFGTDNVKNICVQRVAAWLNAPADCVKQNAGNDTQANLCKADNTESEGKENDPHRTN